VLAVATGRLVRADSKGVKRDSATESDKTPLLPGSSNKKLRADQDQETPPPQPQWKAQALSQTPSPLLSEQQTPEQLRPCSWEDVMPDLSTVTELGCPDFFLPEQVHMGEDGHQVRTRNTSSH
jgi:hypothetical protein